MEPFHENGSTEEAMASIKDVARRAGVSVGTVSRVINGAPNVSPERRSRIEQAIKELGYKPHPMARSLRSKRSHMLGLLVPDIANPFFAELARSVAWAASSHGFELLLAVSGEDRDADATQLRSLAHGRVDGVIMVPSVSTTTIPPDVQLPIVVVDRRLRDVVSSVCSDQVGSMQIATGHLARLGHTRIGFIAGPAGLGLSEARQRGWASVAQPLLKAQGLKPSDYIVEGAFEFDSGYNAARSLLESQPLPTAIVCSNDQQAIGAIRAVVDRGLSVPNDISVIGLDGISLGDLVTPRLTTVAQPIHEIGRLAVDQLAVDALRRGSKRARHIVVKPRLVVRESTAPPKESHGRTRGGRPEAIDGYPHADPEKEETWMRSNRIDRAMRWGAVAAMSAVVATGATTAAQDEKPYEGQTVTVAVGSFMSSGVTMFQDEWEQQTGAKLEVVEIPFGDLYQRLLASFTTGAGQFDVAIYAANWIPEFARDDYLLSLEPYYPQKDNWDSVLPKTQKIMYVGGERYSVPMDGDVIIGYYRTDALDNPEYQARFEEQYGYPLAPPETWDQYRDIAEFFTGWDWAGTGENGWGVLEAQGAKDVGPFILASRAAAYAANPEIPGSMFFDPETMEPQVGNPGWVQALNDWIDIKPFGPPEMANYGGGDMRGNFVAGDYALGIDWADVGIIAQDETASTVKGKLGYFVLPGATEVWNLQTGDWDTFDSPSQAPYLGWGGWHGSVAANSDVPDAAWDLLNFIDSTPNAFRAVTTPGTARNPYRTDHFSDSAAWEEAPVQYQDPAPYLETQLASMDHPNAQFDLRIPRAGLYFDVLDTWAQQALGGGLSAEEALANAADEWVQITADEGLEEQLAAYRDLYDLP